jgi:hypothetical protein
MRRRILQKQRSAFMNQLDFDAQIQQDFDDSGLDTPLPTTLDATILDLTATCKEIQSCAANSAAIRAQESVDQAIIGRELGHTDKAKILDNIRTSESKNVTFRMFKNVCGKNQKSNLTPLKLCSARSRSMAAKVRNAGFTSCHAGLAEVLSPRQAWKDSYFLSSALSVQEP